MLAVGDGAVLSHECAAERHGLEAVRRGLVAYPSAKLILEADGRTWHQRIADVLRDRSRDLEAAREGWQTLRFMWEHLRDDPTDAGATVRDVLALRLGATNRRR